MEENLRQLGRDHLDVVNLRRMRQDSVAEHFGALAKLRQEGLDSGDLALLGGAAPAKN